MPDNFEKVQRVERARINLEKVVLNPSSTQEQKNAAFQEYEDAELATLE